MSEAKSMSKNDSVEAMSVEDTSARSAMKLAIEAMQYADACLKKQLTTKTKHEYAQDLLLEAGKALEAALEAHKALAQSKGEACRSDVKQEQSTKCVGEPLFKSIIEKHEGLAEELAAMDKEQSVSVGQPLGVEPVAWTIDSLEQEIYENTREFVSLNVMEWLLTRFNTTPYSWQQRIAERKPLTDEQMWNLWNSQGSDDMTLNEAIAFARAVEAAHGIAKEKNT